MLKLNECYDNLVPTLWYEYTILNASGYFTAEGRLMITRKGNIKCDDIAKLIRYMKSDQQYVVNIY